MLKTPMVQISKTKHLVVWVNPDIDLDEISSPHWSLQPLVTDKEISDFFGKSAISVAIGSARLGLKYWQTLQLHSGNPGLVIMFDSADMPFLPEFINGLPGVFVLEAEATPVLVCQTIASAIEKFEELSDRRRLQRESSKKYRELESLNAGLEEIVEERTRHIEGAKNEEEEKLNKVRNLIRFIKELSSVHAHEEFLEVLRREVRKLGQLGDPILMLDHRAEGVILFSYQSGHFVRGETKLYPHEFGSTALPELSVQKYLANHFGRPFGRIFVLPLEVTGYEQSAVSAYLCFEHFLGDLEFHRLMSFLLERLETMSITVDRILLEQDHTENAFRWEKTFDSLARPIAIIDLEYKILRNNRQFVENEQQDYCYQSFAHRTEVCEGCPLAEALEQGRPGHGTIKIKDRNAQEKVYQVHSYPINLESGRPTNVVNVYIDITQSRELYIRLLQSEKMGALGVLAGNIAHELNNPLTGIRSLAQVLLSEIKDNESLASDLREIEKATDRSQKIIRNLQDFSNRDVISMESFNLDEVIERTMPMLKTLLRNHRYEILLNSGSCLIKGEPQLIQQVIFNLINNACQSMTRPGTLRVETEVIETSHQVTLRIKDTGAGIPKDIATRIFDAFFTTKKEGTGTGLGLSLAKEIVERHNGTIEFETEVGKGTEFILKFPAVGV